MRRQAAPLPALGDANTPPLPVSQIRQDSVANQEGELYVQGDAT
ncbi:hypothetical protein SS05631_b61610 (plasmid) [Sinorhizobium sp. CCBAU 05631]|nr:hypothetical protein SS05631_b61610 [Sinorhizobium sp. CCBAU 05631]